MDITSMAIARRSSSSINRFASGSVAEKASCDAEDGGYSLPFFISSLFATILEDIITQMRLLVEGNVSQSLLKIYVDYSLLRALKYDVEQPAVKDELAGINAKNLGCNDHKINKLDADRKFLHNFLVSMYLDMALRKSFKSLAIQVQDMTDHFKYCAMLIEEEAKNKLNRRELVKQLRQFRNHVKSVYYDTNVIIEGLKTNVEDSALNAEIRSRYANSWQRARTEQNDETIRLKEIKPLTQIEYYKQRSDHEQRVHAEIELLIAIAINETLAKVDSWMNKYDEDMEATDLKIQIMKNKYIAIVEKRENLEETVAKHAVLIKDWVNFKEAREEARLYREKMTNAAIAVQAWWRGLLVRNQLGPYKPQPKRRWAVAGDKGKKKDSKTKK
ncbi:unnamed protein product [Chilo suppressalis]|uniref:Dynein regulatory complex protein 9 n=1 Tax=Chilo suppressalis TaxID=168631 RepID=A0ABN8B2S1_CHISP|nr:unnamed protein product [Chilo suppressalis]